MGSHILEVESVGGFKLYTPIQAKDGTQYQLARREILKATKGKTVHELRQLGYFESWEAARDSVNQPQGNASPFPEVSWLMSRITQRRDCDVCSVGNPGVSVQNGRMVCPHIGA